MRGKKQQEKYQAQFLAIKIVYDSLDQNIDQYRPKRNKNIPWEHSVKNSCNLVLMETWGTGIWFFAQKGWSKEGILKTETVITVFCFRKFLTAQGDVAKYEKKTSRETA